MSKCMKYAGIGLVVMILLGSIFTKALTFDEPQFVPPGDYKRSFQHDGRSRSYQIHIPIILKNQRNIPLVLAFHGGGSNANIMRRSTELVSVSGQKGFAVVFPEGTGPGQRLLTWNGGRCCAYAKRKNVDDVGATAALLDELLKIIPYDKKRVYATGISNGAMICYRLACELSDRIAAIAPVAGNLEISPCNPTKPVPVIHFHGTLDRNVPFGGGVGDRSITKTDYHSVKYTIDRWKAINACGGSKSENKLPDFTNDGTTVNRKEWSNCKNGSSVALITIENGGHTWPGSPIKKWGRLGNVCQDISAAKIMWEFFEKHSRQ